MSNLTNNTTSLQELLAKVNALPEAPTTIPIQSYCQIIAQREGTSGAYGSVAEYAGYNYSDWYPYILKFTTPEFTGKSASLQFNIHMTRGRRNGEYSDTVSFRWALCSSDANFASYDDTKNDVVDTYQIEKGTIEFTGLTSSGTTVTLTVPVTSLAGNTTYYLILWGDGTGGWSQDYVTIEAPTNHTVSLTYEIAASGGSGSGGASVETCTVTINPVAAINPDPPDFSNIVYNTYVDGVITPCAIPGGERKSVTITDVIRGTTISYFSMNTSSTTIDGGEMFYTSSQVYHIKINSDATITLK